MNIQTLTCINIGRNPINAIGAQALRQALHSNRSLTSLGHLDSLPVSVSLRSSLEWYLRNNTQHLEDLRLEAERAATQREGLLKLLPPQEAALRKQLFRFEDERARIASERAAQVLESEQVNHLLHETVKRNAELVDAVATLQVNAFLLFDDCRLLIADAAGRRRCSASTHTVDEHSRH